MSLTYRRLARCTNMAIVQRLRSAGCLFAFASISLLFFYFRTNTPDEQELEFLRAQYDQQSSQLRQMQTELIDANVKLNSMQNSDSECRTNFEAIKSQLDNCQRNSRKEVFGFFQPQQSNQFQPERPLRGDIIPNRNQKQMRMGGKKNSNLDYPKLTAEGNFIPSHLWVHFDFKGAPMKPSYFIEMLPFIAKMGINGILLEWEDMFPYSGRLAKALNGDAYSMAEVESMLAKAKQLGLEVVPLVQTFGHLEWLLKLEEFAHLREDPAYPQVICFGSAEAWTLIRDMIVQVAEVHKRFGLNYFHIGADEVFQLGVCNESLSEIRRQGGRDRAILWHIARTAAFVKQKYSNVTVLAWHDMLVQMPDREIQMYKLADLLQPILWSYAENLDNYLPYSNWMSLKPFRNVWGASAFKGADGPMRYSTNPVHYVRNHESWIEVMTRVHPQFDRFQGLIITGWSRYDHLAALCELFPVALPTLAMSAETILAGRPLGGVFERTAELLQCNAPFQPGYAFGCKFPGKRIYELVNELSAHRQQFAKYADSDFDFNGWLSLVAEKWNSSSPMYIEKILPYVDFYLQPLERIERELRVELPKLFFAEVADEFILTYMSEDLEQLRRRRRAAKQILRRQKIFPRRPFVRYPAQPANLDWEESNEKHRFIPPNIVH